MPYYTLVQLDHLIQELRHVHARRLSWLLYRYVYVELAEDNRHGALKSPKL